MQSTSTTGANTPSAAVAADQFDDSWFDQQDAFDGQWPEGPVDVFGKPDRAPAAPSGRWSRWEQHDGASDTEDHAIDYDAFDVFDGTTADAEADAGEAGAHQDAHSAGAGAGEQPGEHAAPHAASSDATQRQPSAGNAGQTPLDSLMALPASKRGNAKHTGRRSNTGTYVVLGCVAALVVLTMLGGVLNVGDHLMSAHPVLGWVFYLVLAALVVVGVVVPLVKVAQRPIFSLYQLHDESGRAKRRHCRMLVDNLVANTNLSDEEVAQLEGYLEQGDKADDLLIAFFNERCVPAIDDATKRAATTAFFVAAISRSPLVSAVTMLSLCLDLVRQIVETCGFRPTNLGLARLYTRVMISALIIGGIEDSDLGDLLGQLMGGGAGARAGGLVLGATTEGLMSAFLVFRVGVITKRWLTAADGPTRMAAIRRTSYREALSLMRTSGFLATITETIRTTTGTVASTVANSMAGAARSTVENVKSAFAAD